MFSLFISTITTQLSEETLNKSELIKYLIAGGFTLLGVIIGGLITTITNLVLNRMNEKNKQLELIRIKRMALYEEIISLLQPLFISDHPNTYIFNNQQKLDYIKQHIKKLKNNHKYKRNTLLKNNLNELNSKLEKINSRGDSQNNICSQLVYYRNIIQNIENFSKNSMCRIKIYSSENIRLLFSVFLMELSITKIDNNIFYLNYEKISDSYKKLIEQMKKELKVPND